MSKWDIDKALGSLEAILETTIPGTILQKIIMDTSLMVEVGMKPKPEHVERGHGIVWSLGIGELLEAKRFFHGHTIREAYLRARKGLGLTKKGNKKRSVLRN
jgi:hypothetical protein